MRPARALWLLAASFACSGCALVEDGSRNLSEMVCKPWETHHEKARNRRWAESAWQEHCARTRLGPWSEDLAEGFKSGYAEYLFRGGNGEPPLMAPHKYRHVRYQTPQGYHAIEDWFTGYRMGAAVARDTGARKWITGPTSLEAPLPDFPSPHPAPLAKFQPPTPPKLEPEPIKEPPPIVGIRPGREEQARRDRDPEFMIPSIDLPVPTKTRIMGVTTAPIEEQREPVRIRINNVRTAPENSEPMTPPIIKIKGVRTPDGE